MNKNIIKNIAWVSLWIGIANSTVFGGGAGQPVKSWDVSMPLVVAAARILGNSFNNWYPGDEGSCVTAGIPAPTPSPTPSAYPVPSPSPQPTLLIDNDDDDDDDSKSDDSSEENEELARYFISFAMRNDVGGLRTALREHGINLEEAFADGVPEAPNSKQKIITDLIFSALCYGNLEVFKYIFDNISLTPFQVNRKMTIKVSRFRNTQSEEFSSQYNLLSLAVNLGHTHIVRYLIEEHEHPVNLYLWDSPSAPFAHSDLPLPVAYATPASIAIKDSHEEILELLLDAGGDIFLGDSKNGYIFWSILALRKNKLYRLLKNREDGFKLSEEQQLYLFHKAFESMEWGFLWSIFREENSQVINQLIERFLHELHEEVGSKLDGRVGFKKNGDANYVLDFFINKVLDHSNYYSFKKFFLQYRSYLESRQTLEDSLSLFSIGSKEIQQISKLIEWLKILYIDGFDASGASAEILLARFQKLLERKKAYESRIKVAKKNANKKKKSKSKKGKKKLDKQKILKANHQNQEELKELNDLFEAFVRDLLSFFDNNEVELELDQSEMLEGPVLNPQVRKKAERNIKDEEPEYIDDENDFLSEDGLPIIIEDELSMLDVDIKNEECDIAADYEDLIEEDDNINNNEEPLGEDEYDWEGLNSFLEKEKAKKKIKAKGAEKSNHTKPGETKLKAQDARAFEIFFMRNCKNKTSRAVFEWYQGGGRVGEDFQVSQEKFNLFGRHVCVELKKFLIEELNWNEQDALDFSNKIYKDFCKRFHNYHGEGKLPTNYKQIRLAAFLNIASPETFNKLTNMKAMYQQIDRISA